MARSPEPQTKQKIKKPRIDFQECGIPVGSELIFVEDPSIVVTVYDSHRVLYKEEITSLSAVAGSIKGRKAIQGSLYFTYNGDLVTDIAERTQWKDL